MINYMLEACVDSVESALAATRGGAKRLELCSNLIIGGTTPGPGLFQEIRKVCDTRIHALIRPRFGDFCYSEYEFSIIKEEIRMFRRLGAEGVVIGVLKPDGTLWMDRMEQLMEEAGEMWVTLHRAFDVCADPLETLAGVQQLGIRTILTSGQRNRAIEGTGLLKRLVKMSKESVEIMAGSGIGASVLEELHLKTGCKAYHMSGKVTLDSAMEYRKEGVNMGLPAFSEYEIWQTGEEKIKEAVNVLENIL